MIKNIDMMNKQINQNRKILNNLNQMKAIMKQLK